MWFTGCIASRYRARHKGAILKPSVATAPGYVIKPSVAPIAKNAEPSVVPAIVASKTKTPRWFPPKRPPLFDCCPTLSHFILPYPVLLYYQSICRVTLRYPIPSFAHPESKQSHVKLSLDTRCPKEALNLSRLLCYAAQQILAQPRVKHMEYQQIRSVLTEHFKGVMERRKQRVAINGLISPQEREGIERTQALTLDALEHDNYEIIGTDHDIARFADQYSLSLQVDTPAYETFRKELLKATRDYCAAALKLDDGLASYDFSEESTTPAPQPKKAKQHKLTEAIDSYCKEKVRLNEWRPNVAKEYCSQFNLLLRIVGGEAPLDLSFEQAEQVKTTLLLLPKHMGSKPVYKDKSIAELTGLSLHASQRLSPVSIAKHIRTYSTFYTWAVKQKRVTENHFSALVDNASKTALIREAFNPQDIRRIMDVVLKAKKGHQKWGVLIAFYTGARLNEIAQLDASDIIEEDGIPCFRFTDEGDEKRLKNLSSKRIVPVHPKLIELGFMEYVSQQTNRLFPQLSYHPKDGYGRNLGRWFNESLLRKQLSITSPSLVFHSIRHTVAQQLRNAQVQEATIKDILGHSQEGVTMQTYAKNLDKRVMLEAVEKLDYSA